MSIQPTPEWIVNVRIDSPDEASVEVTVRLPHERSVLLGNRLHDVAEHAQMAASKVAAGYATALQASEVPF